MQEAVADIQKYGAALVAITPQKPEHSLSMTQKHGLTFDLLHDAGNAYAERLGLRFAVPDEVRQIYSGFGINLPAHNGEDSWTLPMPGRFVVSKDGTIRTADVDPDYTRRPEPQKTREDLAALG